MNAEILCIGTELILGDIVNTNAQYLSKQLAAKGINVFYQSTVGDNPERIIKALSIAITRSNLIIFTGGLGPTADDITVKTVSEAIGVPLERNEEAYQHIVEYFQKTGRVMSENNEKQAYLPKGSVVFQNEKGTAPGCAIESGNQCIVFLPGPPSELQAMFEGQVSGYLDKYSTGIIKSKFIKIYGVGESIIDREMGELIKGENPTVAPYAKDGEAELRITAKALSEKSADRIINETVEKVKSVFKDNIYGYDDDSLQSVVVKMLKDKGMTVSTAESCTAGYISKRITDISGSSEVFNMGVITYSNESKTKEIYVPEKYIKEYGAVSMPVAACMAKGIRVKSGADIGLSITGIAGPKSDESGKPVGLSYIAISDKDGEYVIKSEKGSKNDREYIRYTSASEALNFLRLYLKNGIDGISDVKKVFAVLDKAESDSVNAETVTEKATDENTEKMPEEKVNVITPTSAAIAQSLNIPLSKDENTIIGEDNSDKYYEPKLEELAESKVVIKDAETLSEEEEKAFEKLDIIQFEEDKKRRKESKKTPIRDTLFIRKGDTPKEVARKIIFWLALIAFIFAAGNIAYYYINPLIQQNKLTDVSKEFHNKDSESYYSSEINPKFASLYKKNKDLIGWITVGGTNIDYPVMQSKDEDFYLRRNFDKSDSREGSIFASKASSIKYREESKNVVLYGHHMVSTGTMFKDLDNYLNLGFYKQNPTLSFDTLYRDSDYKIFAVFITNSVPEQDNGNFYDYQITKFPNETVFSQWINEARIRSIITTNVDVKLSDEILTLQTCNDSFETDGNKARLVIMARRVRDGESIAVDTALAKLNKNPKYPQIWYDIEQSPNPFVETTVTTSTTSKEVITEKTTESKTTATDSRSYGTTETKTTVRKTAKSSKAVTSTTKIKATKTKATKTKAVKTTAESVETTDNPSAVSE